LVLIKTPGFLRLRTGIIMFFHFHDYDQSAEIEQNKGNYSYVFSWLMFLERISTMYNFSY